MFGRNKEKIKNLEIDVKHLKLSLKRFETESKIRENKYLIGKTVVLETVCHMFGLSKEEGELTQLLVGNKNEMMAIFKDGTYYTRFDKIYEKKNETI
jgi:hypothetical protein